ncbi:MAG: Stk1 family PASTA domain-containing Ser/Thr kinase [Clostridiales bacterium]|nr:Stk1 family PASTA domain-containing Ser/Thr kinase [Clostridiales bacterium]
MENYVGKRLDGRYEIQEIIGVGGMAVVYKAYDNVDDRIVAVKILKDEFSDDAEFVRRFKNESKAIAVLSHPNIVKVYDVSFGEKIQYIVMEYVDGITLKEYIQKQHVITWNDAVFFTTQILKALQHAHDKGIVHRDIKPQNIILLPTGNIKVTDFGIARFSRTETRTLTENAIGSVHYISPEQAKGEATDERADIYSVGVVLYEMLAGKVPFEADSAVSVALMQLQKEPERLTRINPDIPLGIEQICIHAMQKNPADRYQTATEMLLDLEEVIRNPNAVFDYTYFVDKEPTKYMFKEENLQKSETDNSDVLPDTVAEEDPNHKKKVITAVSVGIVVLIAAVVALVLFMTQGLNTNTHKLENFVGQSYDDLVSNSSYDYEFVAEYQTSSDAAAGTVLSQSPEAGTRVISGSKVTLYVASSDESLIMPNCYNLTLDKAERALEMSKLTNYKVAEVSSESVEEGSVVYTEPKASEAVSADQQIVLYISSGPSTTTVKSFKVPDVSGLSQNDAKDFLEKSGFTNITIETEDSLIRKGVVLSQTPSAGNTVKENEAIKLTVSTGVVTTSTQPAERTVTLKIKLPKFSQSPVDTLVVDIDGKKTEKAVVLNGGTEIITFSAYDGDEISGNVSLTDATGGAANNFKISVNGDKTVNIDLASTVGE